jgi:hypothetical protein
LPVEFHGGIVVANERQSLCVSQVDQFANPIHQLLFLQNALVSLRCAIGGEVVVDVVFVDDDDDVVVVDDDDDDAMCYWWW